MNTIKKRIRRLYNNQTRSAIVWAAAMIAGAFVFKESESSRLILIFLIAGATIHLNHASRLSKNYKCDRQEKVYLK
ncbi:MAG: hypothetical protein DRI71_04335 [Bacteroidetes bacterium]|nr:MAG: hypothetical protein DRI71_04335 [Bacteroidota bacterium]